MIPREVLRKVRQIEIRTRHLVADLFGGEYHSVFKGRGMEFAEVREYTPGDDVRSIDWNVTARMGHPFIKQYQEERELTVLLLVDQSASGRFGTQERLKAELAAEVGALLALSAVQNNDKVGLVLFTDGVELYVPPAKGRRNVLRVVREILYFRPERKGTDLAAAIDHVNHAQKRKAVVFVLSDFLTSGFERSLSVAARRHDVVALRMRDAREEQLPKVGVVALRDLETAERPSRGYLGRRGPARVCAGRGRPGTTLSGSGPACPHRRRGSLDREGRGCPPGRPLSLENSKDEPVKRVFLLTVLGLSGISLSVLAEESADTLWVDAVVRPPVVRVGERVEARFVIALEDSADRLIGPPAPARLGDLDLVRSEIVPTGTDSVGWLLEAALFAPGEHDLSSIPFTLLTASGRRPLRLRPYSVSVVSSLPDSLEGAEIRDIKGPLPVPARWSWARVLGALLLVCGLAIALFLWIRRPRLESESVLSLEPHLSPEEAAEKALRELSEDALPARGKIKEHYVRLSLILRHYLERRHDFPAVESTTDEIRDVLESRRFLDDQETEGLMALYDESDLVKFARFNPGREPAEAALLRARDWVESQRPALIELPSLVEEAR